MIDQFDESMCILEKPSRIVVKIGSSTLTSSESFIDREYLVCFTAQIADLRSMGHEIVIVSSGAIACGLEALGMTKRPKDMPSLQAAASVGQSILASAYAQEFGRFDITTSLVLLTRRDTADRNSYLHARDTLSRLLDLGVVPIVNENDTVSVEQIKFGDNDTLAALVACLIDADLVVLMSDIEGLYDSNPKADDHASLIKEVRSIDKKLMSLAGESGSSVGSGGMITKLKAARVLMAAGIPMMIVDGKHEDVLVDIAKGKVPGTIFIGNQSAHDLSPRKLWIALADSSKGRIVIDDGARSALLNKGASLLSVGITRVEGSFDADDCIDIIDSNDMVIARGIASFSSDEVALALGRDRDELLSNRLLTGFANRPVMHRDDMMLFE